MFANQTNNRLRFTTPIQKVCIKKHFQVQCFLRRKFSIDKINPPRLLEYKTYIELKERSSDISMYDPTISIKEIVIIW